MSTVIQNGPAFFDRTLLTSWSLGMLERLHLTKIDHPRPDQFEAIRRVDYVAQSKFEDLAALDFRGSEGKGVARHFNAGLRWKVEEGRIAGFRDECCHLLRRRGGDEHDPPFERHRGVMRPRLTGDAVPSVDPHRDIPIAGADGPFRAVSQPTEQPGFEAVQRLENQGVLNADEHDGLKWSPGRSLQLHRVWPRRPLHSGHPRHAVVQGLVVSFACIKDAAGFGE